MQGNFQPGNYSPVYYEPYPHLLPPTVQPPPLHQPDQHWDYAPPPSKTFSLRVMQAQTMALPAPPPAIQLRVPTNLIFFAQQPTPSSIWWEPQRANVLPPSPTAPPLQQSSQRFDPLPDQASTWWDTQPAKIAPSSAVYLKGGMAISWGPSLDSVWWETLPTRILPAATPFLPIPPYPHPHPPPDLNAVWWQTFAVVTAESVLPPGTVPDIVFVEPARSLLFVETTRSLTFVQRP